MSSLYRGLSRAQLSYDYLHTNSWVHAVYDIWCAFCSFTIIWIYEYFSNMKGFWYIAYAGSLLLLTVLMLNYQSAIAYQLFMAFMHSDIPELYIALCSFTFCFCCSTTHEFLFGALAELLDNARCVQCDLFLLRDAMQSVVMLQYICLYVHLFVRPSVCDVQVPWSHRLE